jgi:hypothetical protein
MNQLAKQHCGEPRGKCPSKDLPAGHWEQQSQMLLRQWQQRLRQTGKCKSRTEP